MMETRGLCSPPSHPDHVEGMGPGSDCPLVTGFGGKDGNFSWGLVTLGCPSDIHPEDADVCVEAFIASPGI